MSRAADAHGRRHDASAGKDHHADRYRRLQLVVLGLAILGFAMTIVSIAMEESGSDAAPWHFLIGLVGIPTALLAAFLVFLQAVKEE